MGWTPTTTLDTKYIVFTWYFMQLCHKVKFGKIRPQGLPKCCSKLKFNKRTVPNKKIQLGKLPEIDKHMAYVYQVLQSKPEKAIVFLDLNGRCLNMKIIRQFEMSQFNLEPKIDMCKKFGPKMVIVAFTLNGSVLNQMRLDSLKSPS